MSLFLWPFPAFFSLPFLSSERKGRKKKPRSRGSGAGKCPYYMSVRDFLLATFLSRKKSSPLAALAAHFSFWKERQRGRGNAYAGDGYAARFSTSGRRIYPHCPPRYPQSLAFWAVAAVHNSSAPVDMPRKKLHNPAYAVFCPKRGRVAGGAGAPAGPCARLRGRPGFPMEGGSVRPKRAPRHLPCQPPCPAPPLRAKRAPRHLPCQPPRPAPPPHAKRAPCHPPRPAPLPRSSAVRAPAAPPAARSLTRSPPLCSPPAPCAASRRAAG